MLQGNVLKRIAGIVARPVLRVNYRSLVSCFVAFLEELIRRAIIKCGEKNQVSLHKILYPA